MLLADRHPGDVGDHVRQLIDREHAILSQVQRLMKVRLHELVNADDTVVDVTERSRLLPVSPDLDLLFAGHLGDCNLPTQSCRRLLPSSLPRSQWAEDVMKAN